MASDGKSQTQGKDEGNGDPGLKSQIEGSDEGKGRDKDKETEKDKGKPAATKEESDAIATTTKPKVPFADSVEVMLSLRFQRLSGNGFEMSVVSSCSIAELTHKIEAKLELGKSCVRIGLKDLVFRDVAATLQDLGVNNGDELTLVVLPPVPVVRHIYENNHYEYESNENERYDRRWLTTDIVHLICDAPLCDQLETLWPVIPDGLVRTQFRSEFFEGEKLDMDVEQDDCVKAVLASIGDAKAVQPKCYAITTRPEGVNCSACDEDSRRWKGKAKSMGVWQCLECGSAKYRLAPYESRTAGEIFGPRPVDTAQPLVRNRDDPYDPFAIEGRAACNEIAIVYYKMDYLNESDSDEWAYNSLRDSDD